MPTAWVRGGLIAGVAGVCAFSALSNHVIYRNAPFQRAAAALEQYMMTIASPGDGGGGAGGEVSGSGGDMATTTARRLVPGSDKDISYVPYMAAARPLRPAWFWPPEPVEPRGTSSSG